MKKVLLILLSAILLITSLTLPVSAQDKVLGRTVIFEQQQSSANEKVTKLSKGVPINGWYVWITHGADGFDTLYSALDNDNVELIIKYKGDYDIHASFTHWGTVSSVPCSEVKIEGDYNYAIFNSDAVKKMFTNFETNQANIDENGNVKNAIAMSLDGRGGNNGYDTIYGVYVVSAIPLDPKFSTTATIDMNKTYQTIDGFGASYTWYSDWLTGVDVAETGYDWIFNEAEFNILRFRDQHGMGNDEKYEPTKGYPKYKAYYNAAVKRGIKPIVLVTSWGQYDRNLPFVQYIEKSANGYSYYTLAKNKKGEYMYDELAEFCVKSIQYFFDAGIPVDYFSISNEIELQERHTDEQGNARDEAGFFFGFEETEDRCAYWKAHMAVYKAFKKAFGDKAPKIIGAETMAGENYYLHGYLDPLVKHCPESLEVVAHHLYGTSLSERNFAKIYRDFGNYRLWQTEWYENDYMLLGEVIVDELANENISAFIYWNGVWIEDNGNCLIEISTFYRDAKIYRRGGHYIMTHFSKFIKNGYQRVDVSEGLKSKLVAFKSPKGDKLVVVAANNTASKETLNIVHNNKVLSSKVYQSTESDGKYLKDLGKFKDGLNLPAGSLTTIVFELDSKYVPPVTEQPKEEPKEEFTFTVEDIEDKTMYSKISLNVRSGPSVDFDRVEVLNEGEAVTVTGIASTGWYQVLIDGEVGYASGKYLTDEAPKIEEPVEEKPVEEEPVEEIPTEDEPIEEAPTEDEPVEEAPVEDEPIEEAPSVDEPIEDEPVVEAPVEDEPNEDKPDEDKPIDTAPTQDAGDDINLTVYVALIAAAVVLIAIVIVIIFKKKK